MQISHPKKQSYDLKVNGNTHLVESYPETPILYILRNQLSLYGPKYGCGLGQCGACMIMLNGHLAMSCLISVEAIGSREITTLAGLVEEDGTLHPVQQAFIDEQAAQCGYCTNGMILSAVALLQIDSNPDQLAIRHAMQNNLCRCGSQSRVMRAIHRCANPLE